MDSKRLEQKQPQSLSTCSSSSRRRSYDSQNSPEFEFWMVRNPSAPQQDLISADELFVNGVLLPLDLLPLHQKEERQPDIDACPESEPGCKLLSSITTTDTTPLLTSSKRWTDIFKKNEKKNTSAANNQHDKNNDKDRRKEKKSQIGLSSAELNINIWPFSRSRSAGTRPSPTTVGTTRKVSSAPCSRSNSAGESKSRKWPSSPSRPGVHLGRTSPVWQVRRSAEPVGVAKNADNNISKKKKVSKQRAKALNLKVPMCIGYRHQLSCRSDESSALESVVGSGSAGESSGNSFRLRSIFTKKVC